MPNEFFEVLLLALDLQAKSIIGNKFHSLQKTQMKRNLITVFLATIVCQLAISQRAEAQNTYNTALGLRVEMGSDYGTWAGFSAKHFFSGHSAGEGQLLFGDDFVVLGLEYQWHGNIPNADGLLWYFGFGPAFAFGDNATDVILRPMVGLDYKIPNVPLNFGFDWRPAFVITNGSDFNAARFGLAIRYAF